MPEIERFATALTCIDGRIHECLRDWIQVRTGAGVVDLVTVQGPDRVLARADDAWVLRLADRVQVSHRAHGSTTLVIASHSDCAGHPVPDSEHHEDLQRAAARIGSLCPAMNLLTVHVESSGDGTWRVVETGGERVSADRPDVRQGAAG